MHGQYFKDNGNNNNNKNTTLSKRTWKNEDIYIYLNPIKIVKKCGRNKFKCISDYSNENGIDLSNK